MKWNRTRDLAALGHYPEKLNSKTHDYIYNSERWILLDELMEWNDEADRA